MSLSRPTLLPGPAARPVWPLPGGMGLGLARGRVHELCGPARWTLAAMLMAQDQAQGLGPVVWIAPAWQAEQLHAPGLAGFADPGRLIFAAARRVEDMLWAAEESLRSGSAALVVVDLTDPPALTPVRRLHLAAEAGAELARTEGHLPPLGVLLTPGQGGAQGVESRWQMTPAPSTSTLLTHRSAWRLDRLRARMEPPSTWTLTEADEGRITGARGATDPLA